MDPLKHANSAGTSRHGGVIAPAGDDRGCQSSTLAHQSEQVFAAAMMPVLNPATLQDYLDLGILGFALSRYSGCWVGFKAISETVESSASIFGDPTRIEIVTPDDFTPPPDGLWMRWPDPPMAQERRLHGPKMEAVAAFARANKLDRIVLDSRPARLGILATGKAYLDLRQALADLGITDDVARQLGLRIYKVALTWRWKKPARGVSPKGSRTFSSPRRSAASSRTSWCGSSTTSMHRNARWSSASATKPARRCCRATAS